MESLIFCFLWPQVTWCKVTLIQPLLIHRTMTFYATDQPHQGMDLQYVANLVFPVTLSLLIFQHSSLPLPLILPSGRQIRVVWEDLDIMLFPCVIAVSHQWLVISHVATLSPSADFVSPHPVKATFFFSFFFEIHPTFWSLRPGFPRWDAEVRLSSFQRLCTDVIMWTDDREGPVYAVISQ